MILWLDLDTARYQSRFTLMGDIKLYRTKLIETRISGIQVKLSFSSSTMNVIFHVHTCLSGEASWFLAKSGPQQHQQKHTWTKFCLEIHWFFSLTGHKQYLHHDYVFQGEIVNKKINIRYKILSFNACVENSFYFKY